MTLLPISLPQGSVLKVKVNDKVSRGKVLATVAAIEQEVVIHLAKDFSVPIKNFESFLLRKPGDFIEQGNPIAFKKKLLGKSRILSKISGTVSKIDVENGDLYIKIANESSKEEQSIVSPVEGTIEICNNEKIVIKTNSTSIMLKDAIGKSVTGEVFEVKNPETAEEVQGKIVVIESATRLFIYKSLSLGAKGIISQDLEDLDFIDLQGKNFEGSVALVDKEIFAKIKKMTGKNVSIDTENKSIAIL